MPARKFICPNGQRIFIEECLKACPMTERCMFLPTLRAVAKSLNGGLPKATVTELLAGNREIYLKETVDYAISPQDALYALHGQAVHRIHENHTEGDMLAEVRLKGAITSG